MLNYVVVYDLSLVFRRTERILQLYEREKSRKKLGFFELMEEKRSEIALLLKWKGKEVHNNLFIHFSERIVHK